MFDFPFLLTAAATMLGFVNAFPPRQILRSLRSALPRASRPVQGAIKGQGLHDDVKARAQR
jgi:hypothetical protein